MTEVLDLDRRVRLESSTGSSRECKFSELADEPYIVLLGEPGMGKTTVLANTAKTEGVAALSVRQLVNGIVPRSQDVLYLDGLDEYRLDGQAADKAITLALAIEKTGVSRWRLSCRSEDWRNQSDIKELQHAANGEILVAHLLPLNRLEAVEILRALGETQPDDFLTKAEAMGASAFTRTPLTITLLHQSVQRSGAWATTRFELFDEATEGLAAEHNEAYEYSPRSSIGDILKAAELASLLLLAAGAPAIWRSNRPAPISRDGRRPVTHENVTSQRDLFNDMLDTGLFNADGNSFQLVHRTVAEFLGARALARAIKGAPLSPALPLSRARALIFAGHATPPSELRGLFAWLTVHLFKLGDKEGAQKLAEADPVSVLAYGDGASFDTGMRRKLLHSLDNEDPFFRMSEDSEVAFSSLAGEDLAADLEAILRSDNRSHLLVTVLDALRLGKPVASLKNTLREIALEAARPEWQRWRAADAWLAGEVDVQTRIDELLTSLKLEQPSIAREALRVHLLAELPDLDVVNLREVLADFEKADDDNTIMRLFHLQMRLRDNPKPELFDRPSQEWRPADGNRRRKIEVDAFLDAVLGGMIDALTDATADTILGWISNLSGTDYEDFGRETQKSFERWLSREESHELQFFNAYLNTVDIGGAPADIADRYRMLTRRTASSRICHYLLDACNELTGEKLAHCLQLVVFLLDHPDPDPRVFWRTYEWLQDAPVSESLKIKLNSAPVRRPSLRRVAREIEVETRQAKRRASNVAILMKRLDIVRNGQDLNNLDWLAELYLTRADRTTPAARLAFVAAETDDLIAQAALTGWGALLRSGIANLTEADLGTAEGKHEMLLVERPVLAALDWALEDEIDANFPTTIAAIIGIRHCHLLQVGSSQEKVASWSAKALHGSGGDGQQAVSNYWRAAFQAGSKNLDGLEALTGSLPGREVATGAMLSLFRGKLPVPANAVKRALFKIWPDIAPEIRCEVARRQLAISGLETEARVIWGLVIWLQGNEEEMSRVHAELARRPKSVANILDGEFVGILLSGDALDCASQRARLVRLLGPWCKARDIQTRSMRVRDCADIVRTMIKFLASDPSQLASSELLLLSEDESLANWRHQLKHARTSQLRLRNDTVFRPPTAEEVANFLLSGPPVNSADLRAIVLEELKRLQDELHSADDTPWKRYWVLDGAMAVTPLEENQCRDYLNSRLRDRMAPYAVAALAPEARRGEETRADILVVAGSGQNLPIEVKRHYNSEIWTAASTQLQGYTAAPGASGYGVYLVFWFGNDAHPTPSRPDGMPGPKSAIELEYQIRDDLGFEVLKKISVVVFDVSRPDAKPASPRKKRKPRKAKTT